MVHSITECINRVFWHVVLLYNREVQRTSLLYKIRREPRHKYCTERNASYGKYKRIRGKKRFYFT
jgi:hypothetical protein